MSNERVTPGLLRVTVIVVALLVALTSAQAAGDKSALSPSRLKLPKGPGSLEGVGEDVDISFHMGQMSYSVPIALPAGHAGHTPSLGLYYNAGGGSGALGMGWSLPVPSIERSTVGGLPNYDSLDEIVADGRTELVRLPGPVGTATYRARFERGFVRYTWVDPDTGGRWGYWKAEYPDGKVGWFGADQDGTPVPSAVVEGNEGVFRWHLSALVDVHGHTIWYSYVKPVVDPKTGAASAVSLLDQVRWVQDASGGVRYIASLSYEDRPDWISDGKPGFEVLQTKRLAAVRVLARGEQVSRYALFYEPESLTGGLSRLASVSRYGRDDKTIDELVFSFEYAAGAVCPEASCAPHTMTGSLGVDFGTGLADFVDMNSDALPDVLVTGGGTGHLIIPNVAGKGWGPATVSTVAKGASAPLLTTPTVNLLDVNGDGYADLLSSDIDGSLTAYLNRGDGDWSCIAGDATCPDEALTGSVPLVQSGSNVRFFDYDNDKDIDVIINDLTSTQFLVTEDGTFGLASVDAEEAIGTSFQQGLQLADMNGDGLQDPVIFVPGGGLLTYRLNLGRGRWGQEQVEILGIEENMGIAPRLMDLNGDALSDVVWLLPGVVKFRINRNGRELGPLDERVTPLLPLGSTERFGDMNGNGSTDIVWITPSGHVTYLDLFPERPNLLVRVDNGIGKVMKLTYGSAATHQADAAEAGAPWSTRLPQPMLVVEALDTFVTLTGDDAGGLHQVKAVHYRDGTWDGNERKFRGFGQVEVATTGDDSIEPGLLRMRFDTGRDDPYRVGLLLEQETYSSGDPIQAEAHNYDDCAVGGIPAQPTTPPIRFVCEAKKTTTLQERAPESQYVVLEEERGYDAWGNQTLSVNKGVVSRGAGGCGACSETPSYGAPCGPTCLGDEQTTQTTFVEPGSDTGGRWLLRLAKTAQSWGDATGAVRTETRTYYDGPTFVGLPLGTATKGLPMRVESRVDGGTFIQSERSSYDDHGNVIAGLDPRSQGSGTPGYRREFEYDADGLLMTVERLRFDLATPPYVLERRVSHDPILDAIVEASDWVRVESGADQTPANATSYGYDALGRMTAVALPGDTLATPTHEYLYQLTSPVSRIITRTRSQKGMPPDLESVQCFDGMGRSVQTRTKLEAGKWQVSGFSDFNTQAKERRRYQPYLGESGLCAATAPQDVLYDDIVYDGMGRPVRTIHPDASEYGGVASMNEVRYAPLVEEAWDEEDLAPTGAHVDTPSRTYKDGLGRVVRVERLLTPTEVQWVDFPYDSLGHMRGWRDEHGNEKLQTYDRLGRVVEVDDPDSGVTSLDYDSAGNVIEHTDARGATTTTFYDEASRPTLREAILPDGSGASSTFVEYERLPGCDESNCGNLAGRVSRVSWESAGTTGEDLPRYDVRGRQVSVTRTVGSVSLTLETAYDNADRIVHKVYPGDITIESVLDGAGRQSAVPGYITSIAYDDRGSLSEVLFANGTRTGRTYDSVKRLSSLVTNDSLGTPIQAYAYVRDRADNITSIADTGLTAGPWTDSATYSYDALYRLTGAVLDPKAAPPMNEVLTYAYDHLDNLVIKTSGQGGASKEHVGAMGHGEGAGPHAPTSLGGSLITYDEAGFRQALGDLTYGWDAEGRLSRVAVDGTPRLEIGYGPTSARVWKVEGDHVTYYLTPDFELRDGIAVLWLRLGADRAVRVESLDPVVVEAQDVAPASLSGGALVPESDGIVTAGDAWVSSVMSDGKPGAPTAAPIDQLDPSQALEASALRLLVGPQEITWVHPNHAGTLSVTTGSLGTVEGRVSTYPFGSPRFQSSEVGMNHTYHGLESTTSAEFALVLPTERALDPLSATWLSADPAYELLPASGNTLETVNRYAFALQNPLRFTDPLGLWGIALTFSAGELGRAGQTVGLGTNKYGLQAWSTSKLGVGLDASMGATASSSGLSVKVPGIGIELSITARPPLEGRTTHSADSGIYGSATLRAGAGGFVGASASARSTRSFGDAWSEGRRFAGKTKDKITAGFDLLGNRRGVCFDGQESKRQEGVSSTLFSKAESGQDTVEVKAQVEAGVYGTHQLNLSNVWESMTGGQK